MVKKKIVLVGELGERFGSIHMLVVSTPAEAVRALCANYPDLKRYLIHSSDKNIGYRILINRQPIFQDNELHNPAGGTEIAIVPVIAGSKGFGKILLGVALIALSFYLPTTALFTLGNFAPSFASIAFGIGSSMVLGGVSQLLAPQPKTVGTSEAVNNKPSYNFDGAVNTTVQGSAVPVGYGQAYVGSVVISAGITSENYTDPVA